MEKKVKILLLLFASAILFSVLHNVFYAVFSFEEPIFFTLSLLAGFSFIVFFVYVIVSFILHKFVKKKKR
ncbi:hypothetical protein CL621_03515 [archaeon]|nr:hypothetical protein [archaeon]|tara:strand:- start:1827 stop:2036 length:210 start_codon:yes stop_codon:yes gene_type:complete